MAIYNATSCRALRLRVSVVTIRYVIPPLHIQKEIVARIEEGQKLVDANKKLIELFEGKIKAKIAEVWG